MTNLGILFEEARKKYSFDKKSTKHYPTDHKRSKLSSTGFFNVKRLKSNKYIQGFCYIYRLDSKKQISSVDILKLKDKVIDAGGDWYIYDKQKALDLANYHNIDIKALI